MANLMIVGADHLGTIPEKLRTVGFSSVVHVTGRKVNSIRTEIPENIDVLFVITDYINHNLAKVIKQKAKNQEVPTYFVKRSWSSMLQALQNCPITVI